MTNDRDLRRLLPVLDDETAAPPELVERVWADVVTMLTDHPQRTASPDDAVVAHLEPRRAFGRAERRTAARLVLAAAAVVLVGVAAVAFVGRPTTEQDGGVASVPVPVPPSLPSSTVPVPATTAPPEAQTLAEACSAFRVAVGDSDPLSSLEPSELPSAAAISTWVDGLGRLIADIERLDAPVEADQLLALRLIRTALRSALDDVDAGDDVAARIALSNAAARLDAAPPDCL